ncbi:hypothetical protein IAR50_001470 [Cryptococcus sp. DSM 104548]
MSATTENVQPTNGAAPEVQQAAADVPATTTATETPAEPSLRVYFGKVARGTTEADLTAFIKSAGETESISIHERTLPGRRAHFAFANYQSLDGAKKAVELDGQELNGRAVIVQYAKGEEEANADRKVRNEKRNAARKAAAEKKAEEAKAAKEANGETTEAGEEAEKPKKKKNARKNRRRAPGDEDEGEEGEDASKARIDGEEGATEAAPKKASKPKAKKVQQKKLEISDEDSPSTIFVANLPFSVDDAALTSIFTNLSIQVKSASVVTRSIRRGTTRKSISKGFSFVELEDPSQREEAVQKVNGTLIEGRNITAKVAKLMKEKEGVAEAAAAEPEAKGEEAVVEEKKEEGEPVKLI